MSKILVMLGSMDPEMEAIEQLCRECGVATYRTGATYSDQYRTEGWQPPSGLLDNLMGQSDGVPPTLVYVECAYPERFCRSGAIRIDHHRPGDPGYGRPPSEFLAASSIGQVISLFAREGLLPHGDAESDWGSDGRTWPIGDTWPVGGHHAGTFSFCRDYEGSCWWVEDARTGLRIPDRYVLAAASDHCPAAAYQGQCPGVEPAEIAVYRVECQVRRMSVDAACEDRTGTPNPADHFEARRSALMAEVREAIELIRRATHVALREPVGHDRRDAAPGVYAVDLRSYGTIPSLPEATLRTGECVLATITERGRTKVVLQGAGEGTRAGTAPIEAFLGPDGWAARNGLVAVYGDPIRGFAGGYVQ